MASLKSRLHETVSARLRIGHIGVKSHLHRFEMEESNLCDFCVQCDTIEHYLMHCNQYTVIRSEMQSSFNQLGVPLNMTNVLLGGDFEENIQIKLHRIVIKFISMSGRIFQL